MSRYVLEGTRAAGGLGTVVVYEDTNLDRKVAVKFVNGDHRRLLDELAALQRIRSKHVVEIFDVEFFKPGNQMGIVEEFIEGADLTDQVGKITPGHSFVRLIYQLATGLADIHAVGVIHRDIKPANVRVDREGILKIIDFNLARRRDDAHTQGFMGTRGYAAPELYGNDTVAFDEKVDVYALGVTAWALLHGARLPAELQNLPPRPEVWKANGGGFSVAQGVVDAELLSLLLACISEDPDGRPTAAAVAERGGRVLLRGRHRALFVDEMGRAIELEAGKSTAKLTGSHGTVTIKYDGLDFRATEVTGEVSMNNMEVVVGSTFPKGCVIALGNPTRRTKDRLFVTMDISQPEVVL